MGLCNFHADDCDVIEESAEAANGEGLAEGPGGVWTQEREAVEEGPEREAGESEGDGKEREKRFERLVGEERHDGDGGGGRCNGGGLDG